MKTTRAPADIAREAIRLLAGRRLPPTPDNFRQVYHEVAGETPPAQAAQPGHVPDPAWADTVRGLLRQWDAHQSGLTRTRKQEMLERVLINFGQDHAQLRIKLEALVKSWAAGARHEPAEAPVPLSADEMAAGAAPEDAMDAGASADATVTDCRPLVQQLARNLDLLAQTCDARWPDVAARAGALARAVDGRAQLDAAHHEAWSALWRELLMRVEDDHELADGLKRLMGLLFLNIGELVGDEAWLAGQLAAMHNLMRGEVRPDMLLEAERGLRELAYRQGVLKGSLDEAKNTLKTLVATFIDRVGEMSRSADGYHARIGVYDQRIRQARDIGELGDVVGGLSADVGEFRDVLRREHAELLAARRQAEQAEQRVRELERELAEVSTLVREDQLTGALNRRGMDEAMARELARSRRLGAPLTLALLDVDHFKRLNDRLGHQAGDRALRHLAGVVRGLLRPTDLLARYGGEEFLILLPNTHGDEGEQVLRRIQRELTRQFFLHDNERVLITFSAGVAELGEGEDEAALIARADAAMYRAKQAGRNRVERG